MNKSFKLGIALLMMLFPVSCNKAHVTVDEKKPWSEYAIQAAEIKPRDGYHRYSDEYAKKIFGWEKLDEPLYFPVKESYAYKVFMAIPNYQTETIRYFFFKNTDFNEVPIDFTDLVELTDEETAKLLDKRVIPLCVNDSKALRRDKDKYRKTEPERYYFQLTPEGVLWEIDLNSVKDDLNYMQSILACL